LPKLFWQRSEQGKMTEMSKGILAGTTIDKKYNEKVDNVAQNVANYIKSTQAGHYQYGFGYLFAQVLTHLDLFI
jgi:hypothetical protein